LKFWDSSGIVPLIVEEAASAACRRLLRLDPTQAVWYFTRSEVVSALQRRHREGLLDEDELRVANSRLERFAARWIEIIGFEAVRAEAERVLRVHPLRTADSLQLAAAIVWADGRPKRRGFVALDAGLLGAAEREGFAISVIKR
jgi:predicted nucleic acid-binding protein